VHHYIPHYDILEDVLLQILLVDKTVWKDAESVIIPSGIDKQ
jgi:hypothetical protein